MVRGDADCDNRKHLAIRIAASVLLAITWTLSAAAQTAVAPTQAAASDCPDDEKPDMTFTAWTSTLGEMFSQGSREYIFAAGSICPNTAEKFQQFLEKNPPAPHTIVVFNSGGGNVYAGLKMGRLIRQHKMWTEVGSRFPLMIPQNENIRSDSIPYFPEPASPPFAGECASSCSIAFLGGVVRTVGYASNYGVHQFSGSYQSDPDAQEEMDQVMSAKIVHYLSDMGISPNWIVYMAKKEAT